MNTPIQALIVETDAGNFICAAEDWFQSGLSLAAFLQDNGVLSQEAECLCEVNNVQLEMMTREQLDKIPEWPA